MIQQPFDSTQRTGSHICSHLHTLDDVLRIADRSRQYLSLVIIGAIHTYNITNKSYPVFANIIQTSDKRRNVSRSGFCSQQCLSDGKYQCTIGPDSFFCKVLDSFDTIGNARHLDNDMRIECGKLFPFADHPFIIRCYYFRTYVSIDNLTYFNVMFTLILRTFNAFFRHQRRIGSHSVKYSEVIRLLNLLQIGCVNKKLHNSIF